MIQKEKTQSTNWSRFLEENDEIDFILSQEQLKLILKKIGNDTDKNEFVVNTITKERVISNDEDEIRMEEVGGIVPKSKVFLKDNIASFSHYLAELEEKK